MLSLVYDYRQIDIKDYLDIYLQNKAPDCIIFSEDGAEFKTHKELFSQTKFMRELLKNANCCGPVEMIFPCTKDNFMLLISDFGKPTYPPKNWISFVDVPIPLML